MLKNYRIKSKSIDKILFKRCPKSNKNLMHVCDMNEIE